MVVEIDKFPLPSKEPEPVTEPVSEIVLAVYNLVAVAAFPVQEADEPVILIPQVPDAPDPVLVTVYEV